MSKEKQIDEMAKLICNFPQCINYNSIGECKPTECQIADKAEALYNAGYRKQSEGEWISNELGGYKYAFYCSECGWVDGYPFNDRHKFCPNCGAKMKGGEKE